MICQAAAPVACGSRIKQSRRLEAKVAFVTGGTGFVGSHLVEELHRRGYSEVRCLVRSAPKWLERIPHTPIRADLSDIEAVWGALAGVDYVYHVGGVTRAEDWAAFEKNNVQATLTLLGAVKMAAPSVKKVLVTSSLAAVGRCAGGVADEETLLNPVSRYGRSKAAMERALAAPHEMRASFQEALPIVTVRPPAVYGPRDADIFEFFKTVSRGIAPAVGGGKEPALSLVHVRDLARGMVDAAEAEGTAGETYFIGSEETYSWNDVKEAATAALGTTAWTIPVPGPLVGVVGAASEAWGKMTGTYPALNREKAREIRHACKICSVEKAKKDFGYRQQISLEEGVQETIDWYRAEGWL